MTSSQMLGLTLITAVLIGLVILILERKSKRAHLSPASLPPQQQHPDPAPPTETEQLIQAILLLDRNAAARMSGLKLYLFFLPLIWGVISGILWAIILALR